MLDENELRNAIELQRRSYKLILWLGDEVERGSLRFDRAHTHSSAARAAEDWLSHHYTSLPMDARPLERAGPELRQYANFFVSYLQASFDLEPDPTTRLIPSSGCYCAFCRDLATVAFSHLRLKKLSQSDRERARGLKETYLLELAVENGLDIDPTCITNLLDDEALSRDAALATYGHELVARTRGLRSSPAVLALWREFAWTPHGSPNHRFRLRVTETIKTELKLVAELAKGAA